MTETERKLYNLVHNTVCATTEWFLAWFGLVSPVSQALYYVPFKQQFRRIRNYGKSFYSSATCHFFAHCLASLQAWDFYIRNVSLVSFFMPRLFAFVNEASDASDFLRKKFEDREYVHK